jgi:putative restriction endonuclease
MQWTREHLLVALDLYCKLPFGQFDQRNTLIKKAAAAMGRTPSSVSMKLCNLASLDPSERARGVGGLKNASRADREIWDEFNAHPELAVEIERAAELVLSRPSAPVEISPFHDITPPPDPDRPTERMAEVRQRLGQNFFRNSVLASYHSRCCITGNPVPELLVASHILPWSNHPEQRLNLRNGLCLAQTQDAAFDRGLMTVDEDNRVVLSKYLQEFLPNDALQREFVAFEGMPIRLPEKFLPNPEFLRFHRESWFRG